MDYLSLCLICKDENDYLAEWLDYHILMGVDRFYIYDNESQVSLRESLKEYIERGWVVVIDIPGKAMQLYAYDHCLQTFGLQTFWLGFIDTDEFLVPKTTLDLKELLKEYEAYAGLAVSSLFFGSNGHQTRPAQGQIAAYTRRTPDSDEKNELVKSIVQPGRTLMPYSPHDFAYQENTWCVNEAFLRVEGQHFPNHIEKIQLNHYYCRSESEMDLKLRRGNSGDVAWPRKRFESVNILATFQDTSILQNIEKLFHKFEFEQDCLPGLVERADLLENLATMARSRHSAPLEFTPCAEVTFRVEMTAYIDFSAQFDAAKKLRGGPEEIIQWLLKYIRISPKQTSLYTELALLYINLNDLENAWQVLSQAWQLAPNSFYVLSGMAYYFLRAKNFAMAEKTCYLLLDMAHHDVKALACMTEALLRQERWEEALKIGVPLVELSSTLGGGLLGQMGGYLARKMAGYLLEKKDYTGAAHLWEAWSQCQPDEVDPLIEFANALLLIGDQTRAREALAQAEQLAPQNEKVLALLHQVDPVSQKGAIEFPWIT